MRIVPVNSSRPQCATALAVASIPKAVLAPVKNAIRSSGSASP
ncbi:MAG: hypothetical protein R2882_06555 [Gemmatimonadales bacterium]